MSKRRREVQIWIDPTFKEFLKDIIRRKNYVEKPKRDFTFGDITSDIVHNTELKNGIERILLKEAKEHEARLF